VFIDLLLPLHGRVILLSRVWYQTKLHSTQFNYHYLTRVAALACEKQDENRTGPAAINLCEKLHRNCQKMTRQDDFALPPKWAPSPRLVARVLSLVRISTIPRCMKNILSPFLPRVQMYSPGKNTSNLSIETTSDRNVILAELKNGTVVRRLCTLWTKISCKRNIKKLYLDLKTIQGTNTHWKQRSFMYYTQNVKSLKSYIVAIIRKTPIITKRSHSGLSLVKSSMPDFRDSGTLA